MARRINPHDVIPVKAQDRREATKRQYSGIAQHDAVCEKQSAKALPGFPKGGAYKTEPRNRYQKWLRQEMAEGRKVEGHYTKKFGPKLVEALVDSSISVSSIDPSHAEL